MIGLGTYAFLWQHSDRMERPMTLAEAFEATRALEVDLFQICDFAPLPAMTAAEVRAAASAARCLGLTVQLGTRGVEAGHLLTFLDLAERFDARLVRSMVPSMPAARAAEQLRAAVPAFEAAGVTLALETYEQVATDDLVRLVQDVGSDRLGLCLDPANVVARMEQPAVCVELAAPLVANVHAKDFAFTRRDGWVGFTYAGAVMGEGLHDYAHLLRTVRPRRRGIDEIVEHWLPWQGDPRTTVRMERDWTRAALRYLRSIEE